MNEKIAQIEMIIARNAGQDISYIKWAKGNLERAAASILGTPDTHVGILIGFYIEYADPPLRSRTVWAKWPTWRQGWRALG